MLKNKFVQYSLAFIVIGIFLIFIIQKSKQPAKGTWESITDFIFK